MVYGKLWGVSENTQKEGKIYIFLLFVENLGEADKHHIRNKHS